MNKELQLIFEYATAPASLKTVAASYRQESNRLIRKQVALRALELEVQAGIKQVTELEKAFKAEINAWTPKGE